jgi:putative FmdB family regulatory protein
VPTYQYACTNEDCGNRFELVQSFTDPAAKVCPACDAPVRKVFSAVGVVFKGSGFYRTDSRAAAGKSNGKAKKSTASSESTSSGSGSSSSSGTSDSASSSTPKAAAASA